MGKCCWVDIVQAPGRSQKYLKRFNVADEYLCTYICLKTGLTWVDIRCLVKLVSCFDELGLVFIWFIIELILYGVDIVEDKL